MAFFRDICGEGPTMRCCGFVFTNPRMPGDKLALYYTRDYHLEGLPVPKSMEEFLNDAYKDLWLRKTGTSI